MTTYPRDDFGDRSAAIPAMRMLAIGMICTAIVGTALLVLGIIYLPTLWGIVSQWLDDAGTLKGCTARGLAPAECTGYAQALVGRVTP